MENSNSLEKVHLRNRIIKKSSISPTMNKSEGLFLHKTISKVATRKSLFKNKFRKKRCSLKNNNELLDYDDLLKRNLIIENDNDNNIYIINHKLKSNHHQHNNNSLKFKINSKEGTLNLVPKEELLSTNEKIKNNNNKTILTDNGIKEKQKINTESNKSKDLIIYNIEKKENMTNNSNSNYLKKNEIEQMKQPLSLSSLPPITITNHNLFSDNGAMNSFNDYSKNMMFLQNMFLFNKYYMHSYDIEFANNLSKTLENENKAIFEKKLISDQYAKIVEIEEEREDLKLIDKNEFYKAFIPPVPIKFNTPIFETDNNINELNQIKLLKNEPEIKKIENYDKSYYDEICHKQKIDHNTLDENKITINKKPIMKQLHNKNIKLIPFLSRLNINNIKKYVPSNILIGEIYDFDSSNEINGLKKKNNLMAHQRISRNSITKKNNSSHFNQLIKNHLINKKNNEIQIMNPISETKTEQIDNIIKSYGLENMEELDNIEIIEENIETIIEKENDYNNCNNQNNIEATKVEIELQKEKIIEKNKFFAEIDTNDELKKYMYQCHKIKLGNKYQAKIPFVGINLLEKKLYIKRILSNSIWIKDNINESNYEKFQKFVEDKLYLNVNQEDLANIITLNNYDLEKACYNIEKNICHYRNKLIENRKKRKKNSSKI